MNSQVAFLLLWAVLLASCRKSPQPEPVPDFTGTALLVLNEGNFTWGNASVSLYLPEEMRVYQQVFKMANNHPLGDVLQSGLWHKGELFLVVNNSGKILVTDPQTFEVKRQIGGLTSPRYLVISREGKAYISDLYAGAISVVNPFSGELLTTIPCGGWTEEMLLIGNRLLISNRGVEALQVVDLTLDTIVKSIPVYHDPGKMTLDKNGNLWLLCSGGLQEGLPGLLCFDTATLSVIKDFPFSDLNQSPSGLVTDRAGEGLFWINGNAVYSISIESAQLPENPFLQNEATLAYGLFADTVLNQLYLTDAKDYVSTGTVKRFQLPEGKLLDTFEAGINPSGFIQYKR